MYSCSTNNQDYVQRMALDEREEMKEHMEEVDETTGDKLDDRRMQVC